MVNKKILIGSVVAMMLLSGCANKVHDYSVSTENMVVLKNIAKTTKGVKLGDFTDSNRNQSSVGCRLSTPIGVPEGETFVSYIKKAFEKELVVTDMHNKSAKHTISANLDELKGSTLPAYWEFKMTLSSTNGKSYQTHTKYSYQSSFSAMSACSEMQRSFVIGVQKLIGDSIKNPQFKILIK